MTLSQFLCWQHSIGTIQMSRTKNTTETGYKQIMNFFTILVITSGIKSHSVFILLLQIYTFNIQIILYEMKAKRYEDVLKNCQLYTLSKICYVINVAGKSVHLYYKVPICKILVLIKFVSDH